MGKVAGEGGEAANEGILRGVEGLRKLGCTVEELAGGDVKITLPVGSSYCGVVIENLGNGDYLDLFPGQEMTLAQESIGEVDGSLPSTTITSSEKITITIERTAQSTTHHTATTGRHVNMTDYLLKKREQEEKARRGRRG